MKWFDEWVAKCVQRAQATGKQAEDRMTLGVPINIGLKSRDVFESDDAVRFDLTSAVGGRILTVRRWNRAQDRHDATTYVIPADTDVGDRVSKIVNLELFK